MSDISILTHKMASKKGRSTLKFFFPMDAGSGDVVTDVVSGINFTSTSTADYTEPFATIVSGNPMVVTGSFPSVPLGSSCIFFAVQKVVSLINLAEINIGIVSEAGFKVTSTSVADIRDDNGNLVVGGGAITIATGETHIRALAYDGVSKTLDRYDGVAGASVSQTGSTVDASAIDSDVTPSASIVLATAAPQKYYGFGLYVYDGALPSQATIISELDVIYGNLVKGHKMPSFVL